MSRIILPIILLLKESFHFYLRRIFHRSSESLANICIADAHVKSPPGTLQNKLKSYDLLLILRVARILPWTKNCLARAVIVKQTLVKLGHAVQLKIGAKGAFPNYTMHAWIVVDGIEYLKGNDFLNEFYPAENQHFHVSSGRIVTFDTEL